MPLHCLIRERERRLKVIQEEKKEEIELRAFHDLKK
jgi:hypothetical protein